MLDQILADHQIFSSLKPDQRAQAIRSGIHKIYQNGEWITHFGHHWPYLFLVSSGSVQAIKESPEGRSLLVTEFKGQDVFWGLGFFIEDATMPVALVQQGTTHLQQVYSGTLENILEVVEREHPKPPTLIIIGEVVELREKLSWFRPPKRSEQGATTPILAGD